MSTPSEGRSAFPIRLAHPSVRIEAAPRPGQPFPVEAVVHEEDTYLVLSAAPVLTEPAEHPLRLFAALHDARPTAPGTVVVRAGVPLRLLAVVHDLGAEPSWREEWVLDAMEHCLAVVGERGIRALAMPVLGTVHGRLELRRGLELLHRALERDLPGCLRYLWLVVEPSAAPALESRRPISP